MNTYRIKQKRVSETKTHSIVICFLLAVFLLAACEKEPQLTSNESNDNAGVISNGSNSNIEDTTIGIIISIEDTTPILIGQGNLYGNGGEKIPQQNIVITNSEEWEILKTAMNCVHTFTTAFVDFSTYQVIAVFDEIKGTGGWTIDIVDVTEYSDKIVVEVTNLEKGDDTCIMTQPFHIVKIPVSCKEIVFVTDLYSD